MIGEATARMKERDQPKPPTAENAKMKNDRQAEKLAVASQRAGKQLSAATMSNKTSQKKPSSGPGGGGSFAVGGSKAEWVQLGDNYDYDEH